MGLAFIGFVGLFVLWVAYRADGTRFPAITIIYGGTSDEQTATHSGARVTRPHLGSWPMTLPAGWLPQKSAIPYLLFDA